MKQKKNFFLSILILTLSLILQVVGREVAAQGIIQHGGSLQVWTELTATYYFGLALTVISAALFGISIFTLILSFRK
ncbi:MAG: hypothetical protein OEZ40_01575 [Candidatus Bathyarchaeota archaeon]|nr:hypothetical protein [Candidatus Bathyarchaeota archaeon]